MPTTLDYDATFMREAIALAMQGRGGAEPNPLVGCIIVKDGRVIGRGCHERYGGPHAEPNALAACTESPAGATAYVTLEPCCHTNKQTPPCVPRLIEAKLARVVIGCADPNPLVAGRGIAQLRAAGIEVTVGALEDEAKQLAAPFFARVLHGRPYITLKWAQTADGKIAGPGGRRLQISNATSSRVVHELRGRCDAIVVGVNTVVADDPLLTVRGVTPLRVPRRVVLDSDLRTPLVSQLVSTARQAPVTVYCTEQAYALKQNLRSELGEKGINVEAAPAGPDGRLSLPEIVRRLGARAAVQDSVGSAPRTVAAANEPVRGADPMAISHVLVECGPTLARAFIAAGLADRIWVFHSPTVLGDPTAPAAASPAYPATGTVRLDGDTLTEYLNPRSEVFFTAQESADLILARASRS